jgi:hypothetical protein
MQTVLFLSLSGGSRNRRQIDEMVELKWDTQLHAVYFVPATIDGNLVIRGKQTDNEIRFHNNFH